MPASRVLRDSGNTQSRLAWWSQAACMPTRVTLEGPATQGPHLAATSEPRTLPSTRSRSATGSFPAAASPTRPACGDLSVATTLVRVPEGTSSTEPCASSGHTRPRFRPSLPAGAWRAHGLRPPGEDPPQAGGRRAPGAPADSRRPQPLGAAVVLTDHPQRPGARPSHLGAQQGEGPFPAPQEPWRRTTLV